MNVHHSQDDLDEAGSIERWQAFLRSYSRGEFPTGVYPPTPPISPRQSLSPTEQASLPDADRLYPSTTIDTSTARNVRDYITAHQYMPPPRAADEILREQCVQEYELVGDAQRKNVQQAIDILAAYFPGTVCTFTIFNGTKQSFLAVAGDQGIRDGFGLVHDFEVRSDLGLCGHCVLVKEGILFVPSLPDDWRFARNPYTQAGIQSYIGMPITLPIDNLSTSVSSGRVKDEAPEQTVGIGALNILFVKEPLTSLSETQAMVVRNVARMMQTQLRATWYGNKRTMEARYRRAVAEMIGEGFVGHPVTGAGHAEMGPASTMSLEALAQTATEKLMLLVPQLDSVVIYDVRNTMLPIGHNIVANTSGNNLRILGHSGGAISTPPAEAFTTLVNRRSSRCVFDAAHPSGLESCLPPTAPAHIVMPFSTQDRPALILLATSRRTASFTSSSINTIRSIGAILLARATQDAVVEADAAKTIFLSSISHELRTPLHSIVAALRLAFGLVEDGQMNEIVPLLGAMRSSSVALQGTLDDVLDFGKPTVQAVATGGQVSVSVSKVNVEEVVRDVVRICLMQQSVSSDRQIVYEHEARDWVVDMDEAKFRRIVTNGLTNALKFCPDDTIIISLTRDPSNAHQLQLTITDQGPGIDEDTIPRLLEPFTKQDVHTPGIGLGLHITKTLVCALGGSLELISPGDRGTVFRVSLPVELTDLEPGVRADIRREIVSASAVSSTRQTTPPTRPASIEGDSGPMGSDRTAKPAPPHEASVRSLPQVPKIPSCKGINQRILSLTIDHTTSDTGVAARHSDLHVSDLSVVAKSLPTTTIAEAAGPVPIPMRVMVVDDNAICRRLLAALVSRMVTQRQAVTARESAQQAHSSTVPPLAKPHVPKGSRNPTYGPKPIVRQCADGQSAIDAFLEFRPHVVLTDVSMPGMDGVTAAQHMRALSYHPSSNSDVDHSSSPDDGDAWTPQRCGIYAITGLGSSDPRLKASGLLGGAALDGWFVKGKDDMRGVEGVINKMTDELSKRSWGTSTGNGNGGIG